MRSNIACFFLIIIAQTIFATSCSFFGSDQIVNQKLLGEWKWERSYGGIVGLTVYSDSVDYSLSIYFDKYDNVFWYKNNKLVKKYVVEIGQEEWNAGKVIMRAVNGEEESSNDIKFIKLDERNQLTLMDQCFDCFTYRFQKDK